MIKEKFIDFDEGERLKGCGYRGNTGRKLAYMHDGESWMVKFPSKSAQYAHATLSEYIGSKIYKLLRVPVQDVVLGKCQGQIVVGCRDFTDAGRLLEYSQIKNTMSESLIFGNYGSSSDGEKLYDVVRTMEVSDEFTGVRNRIRRRFWDMFVVDALICNNKRTNSDWGLLIKDGEPVLAPVFGNSNAFTADESFFLDENGWKIDPIAYIKESENPDLKEAFARIASRIDMDKICEMIEGIPEGIYGLPVLDGWQRQRFIDMLIEQERRLRA